MLSKWKKFLSHPLIASSENTHQYRVGKCIHDSKPTGNESHTRQPTANPTTVQCKREIAGNFKVCFAGLVYGIAKATE